MLAAGRLVAGNGKLNGYACCQFRRALKWESSTANSSKTETTLHYMGLKDWLGLGPVSFLRQIKSTSLAR